MEHPTSGRCTATISRNGDLWVELRMYFEIDHTAADTGADNPGASWITDVELEIGGQKIDKQTGLWMECWAELTEPNASGTPHLGRRYCFVFWYSFQKK